MSNYFTGVVKTLMMTEAIAMSQKTEQISTQCVGQKKISQIRRHYTSPRERLGQITDVIIFNAGVYEPRSDEVND
jgi:hypothetical protein